MRDTPFFLKIMELKVLTPTSNSTRHQINLQKNLLSKKGNLVKSLSTGKLKKRNGRCFLTGKITIRHKGGGCKKNIKILLTKNESYDSIILTTVYDSYRSAFLFLHFNFFTSFFFFTLSTENVPVGSLLYCTNKNLELRLGCRLKLENIPGGTVVHSLALKEHNKCNYILSAGTSGQIIQKGKGKGLLKLPSGKILTIFFNSFITLGTVSNFKHSSTVLGKAGKNRLLGKRPCTRGIAMNPVDHPHGGRTNGGRPSVTPWGLPTKGKPTVIIKKI
jgi:large subunit ribosomal protein L2